MESMYFFCVLGIAATVLDRNNLLSHVIGAVCVSGFLEHSVSGQWRQSHRRRRCEADGSLWVDPWLETDPSAFLLGCILGSVIHVIRMKVSHAEHVLAMGPYLSAGVFLAALWGNTWINWYLSLLGI